MEIMKKSNIKINNSLINKHKYSCFSIYIFQFLIFFSLIHKNLSVTFTFPKAITLNNGNIFIIHKLGIDVYSSDLKTLKFNVKEFATNEQISNEQTLAKVVIKSFRESEDDNNLIFCIIINKIYIFEPDGTKKYEETSTSIINIFTGSYYDLTLVGKSGNIYSYIIGFINSQSQAALFLFEYDYDNNINSNPITMTPFKLIKGTEESSISNFGIACEILNHSSLDKVLACFFNSQNGEKDIAIRFINPSTLEKVNGLENIDFAYKEVK